jgi:acetyl-CoA carboxylase biotin carboxyl carrier protein
MPAEPIDLKTIRYLVRLMQRYDLTALDIGEGPAKIRLRRRSGDASLVPVSHPTTTASHGTAAATGTTPFPPGGVASDAAPSPSKTAVIESPMVGTFYSSPAPDAPPFVTIGSIVHRDTTVCVIEAMKVFTDIPAGVEGSIIEILVKNGDPVEFGQPLFRVAQA